jgi:hypothetical protein
VTSLTLGQVEILWSRPPPGSKGSWLGGTTGEVAYFVDREDDDERRGFACRHHTRVVHDLRPQMPVRPFRRHFDWDCSGWRTFYPACPGHAAVTKAAGRLGTPRIHDRLLRGIPKGGPSTKPYRLRIRLRPSQPCPSTDSHATSRCSVYSLTAATCGRPSAPRWRFSG